MKHLFRFGKTIILISISILFVVQLSACGQSESVKDKAEDTSSSEPAPSSVSAETPLESPTDQEESAPSKKDEVPEFVTSTYDACKDVIEENNLSLDLGQVTKNKVNDSVFYEFHISNSTASFQYSKDALSSFVVRLSDKDSNSDLKQIITIVISACDSVDYSTANQMMQSLVNSFDGTKPSNPIKMEKNKYILEPATSSLAGDTLSITPVEESNAFDKSLYSEADAQYMGAKMNKGELAYISGVVKQDAYLGNLNALEIENSEGNFIIYYDLSKFAGEFEVGKPYTFYGTIAGEYTLSGYDGYLRLDYFEGDGVE